MEKEKIKTVYFDMDGTIADLYGVKNWLKMLQNNNEKPYKIAQPMVDMIELQNLLLEIQNRNIKIGIITWLAKNSEQDYKNKTRQAKHEWLKKHLPEIIFNEIHMIQYGTPKHYVAKDKKGLIFDDDKNVRNKWYGTAINPEKEDILQTLKENVA